MRSLVARSHHLSSACRACDNTTLPTVMNALDRRGQRHRNRLHMKRRLAAHSLQFQAKA